MISLTIFDIGIITVITSTISSLVIYIWNMTNKNVHYRIDELEEELNTYADENLSDHTRIFHKISDIHSLEKRIVKIDNDISWIKEYLINK